MVSARLAATAERPCPLCGEPLYAWIVLPAAGSERDASIGLPLESANGAGAERVVERCENCGCALESGVEADLAREFAALEAGGEVRSPNRASLQAWIGVEGWVVTAGVPGRLLLTPKSLALLAERAGRPIADVRTPVSRRAQGWMWQTLLNGLTFHPNFAREVRAGRLRPSTARNRGAFVADAIVTLLGGPLTLLVSAPLELVASLFRRGGEMVATVRAD